ncbi:methylenetetrahydrofolate reductase [Pseudonocardia kujensis]|uniref:methylenetetrahydrofolate reductase n=1 Tax=Pseudonocardia kujensis TaxID=1128675 RepID=UPI001E2C5F17|nr:methylenetetrahydrofolate reductase [Pseudonocardia kujensis]MCE0762039.1 methylenetetrahydrofolate reductase [Pseudonocardia kujensis]
MADESGRGGAVVGTGRRPRARRSDDALAQALTDASYEILPFKGTEEQVLEHVPTSVRLTVTATEAKGLEPTIELAARLAARGYRTAPHLVARLVEDAAHLDAIVGRLAEAGVEGVFVVGGDADRPTSTYPDALALLEALEARDHPFTRIGIGGYPEGHGHIPAEAIERALGDKARHANLLISQLCFAPATTVRWARSLHERGIELPIRVGVPGPVSRQKLVRISAGLGLGQSARFLRKQQSMLWRFFLPGGYSPDRLVSGLAPAIGRSDNGIKGFHFFTFNELAKTEAWRQSRLAELPPATASVRHRPSEGIQ